MTSKDAKGVIDEYAGVTAIDIIMKHLTKKIMPICLFVGDTKLAESKLKERKI